MRRIGYILPVTIDIMMSQGPDKDIINGILKGGDIGEFAVSQLYDLVRTMILDFVHKNNGTHAEGLDILQDAVVTIYEQIRKGNYVHDNKLSTYVYSVARHIWLNRLKRKQIEARILDQQPFEEVQDSPLVEMLNEENERNIKSVFHVLGTDCRQLLLYIIYDNMPMNEICVKMNYLNEQIVRNKKYKCLKQLKDILEARPGLMSFLKTAYHG